MLEKQHEPIAFELAQSVKTLNHQILYLCDSDKEARLIKNELKLFLDDNEIGYYPEREILPYINDNKNVLKLTDQKMFSHYPYHMFIFIISKRRRALAFHLPPTIMHFFQRLKKF